LKHKLLAQLGKRVNRSVSQTMFEAFIGGTVMPLREPSHVFFELCTLAATGPNSSSSPYVINVSATVDNHFATDSGGFGQRQAWINHAYRMVGITDGMGAFDNYDGTFAVLMNHEIAPANGVIRQPGLVGVLALDHPQE
jgi:hypothetical protein